MAEGDYKKLNVTQADADEGRRLLHSDPEAFFKWAEKHIVCDHKELRSVMERSLVMGRGGAEKLLDTLIEGQSSTALWKWVREETLHAVWRVLLFLGAVGGAVYLLREIFR